MDLSYKLEKFEGPLDLLLYMIEKDKIDIYDIPIIEITSQYLEYMRHMDDRDLDMMSDFLVMASTLIDIKIRFLLPREVDEETGEEIDPRTELVLRLLEHKKFKELAWELEKLEEDAKKIWYKDPTLPKEVAQYNPKPDLDILFGDVDMVKLRDIYENILNRKEERIDVQRSKFGNIEKEEISLEHKLGNIIAYLKGTKRFSFKDLLQKSSSRLEVVVSFLAILELMKVGKINLKRDEINQDMYIERVDDEIGNFDMEDWQDSYA